MRVQSFLHDTLDGQTKTVSGFLNHQLFSDIGSHIHPKRPFHEAVETAACAYAVHRSATSRQLLSQLHRNCPAF